MKKIRSRVGIDRYIYNELKPKGFTDYQIDSICFSYHTYIRFYLKISDVKEKINKMNELLYIYISFTLQGNEMFSDRTSMVNFYPNLDRYIKSLQK